MANYLRITGLTVANEDVDSRMAAATQLATTWGKISNSAAIIKKAAAVAEALGGTGTPPDSLGIEIEAVVQNKASAFLFSERPLEVGIVAGVAMLTLMNSKPGTHGWTIADIYTNALWLCLGFQEPLENPKREELRQAVLNAARTRSVKSADAARQRDEVKDFGEATLTPGDEANLGGAIKKAAEATINALRRNALLDREEVDLLWWALSNRSRILNKPLSQLAEPVRVVVAGVEAAQLVRRFPGEAHKELVLRTLDEDPAFDLAELLNEIGDKKDAIAAHILDQEINEVANLLPLLAAIAGDSTPKLGDKIKRSCSEWGARALLEMSLAKLVNDGPPKL